MKVLRAILAALGGVAALALLLLTTLRPEKSPTLPSLVRQVMLTSEMYVRGHSHPQPDLCPSLGAPLCLMIFVVSGHSNRSARNAIRLTWGHYAARRDVSLAFFLGQFPPESKKAIEEEYSLYGDLIIGNNVDAYINLPLKTLSILEWVYTYCPLAPRILKVDDDVFINIPYLLQFLDARKNATNTIWGHVKQYYTPVRNTESKYFVSPLHIPGKLLPEFVAGPAYVLTNDTVSPLFAAALRWWYVPSIEDVVVTGLAADAAGVVRRNVPEFVNWPIYPDACYLRQIVSVHRLTYYEQLEFWQKLHENTICPENNSRRNLSSCLLLLACVILFILKLTL